MRETNVELVMIPGINNSSRLWSKICGELPDWVTAHPVDCPPLDDVATIADALLANLPERFFLCGFSFGGYVALAMLAKAPERISAIALVNSTSEADNASQIKLRLQAIATAEAGGHEAWVNAQAVKVFHPDSLNQSDLKLARSEMVKEYGSDRFISHLRACMTRPERKRMIEKSTIPVLIVAAADDQVISAAHQQAMAEAIPSATFIAIASAGHMLPLEKPRELASTLINWLENIRNI